MKLLALVLIVALGGCAVIEDTIIAAGSGPKRSQPVDPGPITTAPMVVRRYTQVDQYGVTQYCTVRQHGDGRTQTECSPYGYPY